MIDERTKAKRKSVESGLIAVGGCGTNNAQSFLNSLPEQENKHLHVMVLNTDLAQLDHHFRTGKGLGPDRDMQNLRKWIDLRDEHQRLDIVEIGETGMGAGGDPDVGALIGDEAIERVKAFLNKVDIVTIIGGAGKGTGSGAMPVIAQLAADHNPDRPPLAIVTMPRKNEGAAKLLRASVTYRKLLSICPTAQVENDKIRDLRRSYREGWREINDLCLSPVMLALQEISLSVGDMNIDPMDYWNMLKHGRFVQFGICNITSEKEENPELIAQELLNNPYQDERIARRAIKNMQWIHGKLDMERHDKILSIITDSMERSSKDPDFETILGFVEEPGDERKWVFSMFVAKEGPDGNVPSGFDNRSVVSPAGLAESEAIPSGPLNHNGNGRNEVPSPKMITVRCTVNNKETDVAMPEELATIWRQLYVCTESITWFKERFKMTPLELREKIAKHNGGTLPDLPKWAIPWNESQKRKEVYEHA